MRNLLLTAALVGAVAATLGATTPSAFAADVFSFSFNTGDVAFAYSDGYWDRSHQWHKWHNTREAREYRTKYSQNYHAERHDKDRKSMGWRGDQDHDGIPNAVDRDRDGDGRPNGVDRNPNNANRH